MKNVSKFLGVLTVGLLPLPSAAASCGFDEDKGGFFQSSDFIGYVKAFKMLSGNTEDSSSNSKTGQTVNFLVKESFLGPRMGSKIKVTFRNNLDYYNVKGDETLFIAAPKTSATEENHYVISGCNGFVQSDMAKVRDRNILRWGMGIQKRIDIIKSEY